MKILIVSQHYAPDPFRVTEIAGMLAEEGHDVTVLTGLPDYRTGKIPREFHYFRRRRETLDRVRVIRVPVIARRKGVLFRALNYVSFLLASTLYVTFCREKDYDLIFSYQTSPVTMANAAVRMKKRIHCKLFLYCLDVWPECLKAWHVREESRLFRLMLAYSRKIYQACDRIAVTSRPFLEYLARVDGVEEARLTYLPQHALPLDLPDKPLPATGEPVRFVFGGNIGSVQDIPCILTAAKHLQDLPQVYIDLYGDGTELPRCRELAEEWGLDRVAFHGRVPLDVLRQEYERADAFLLTLKAEGMIGATVPAKLQEYMSGARPVFAAIAGGAADIIEEAACGAVVPPSDGKALAEKMQDFVQRPDAYRDCGRNARAYYEQHFTKEIFLRDLGGILEQLTDAGDNPADS